MGNGFQLVLMNLSDTPSVITDRMRLATHWTTLGSSLGRRRGRRRRRENAIQVKEGRRGDRDVFLASIQNASRKRRGWIDFNDRSITDTIDRASSKWVIVPVVQKEKNISPLNVCLWIGAEREEMLRRRARMPSKKGQSAMVKSNWPDIFLFLCLLVVSPISIDYWLMIHSIVSLFLIYWTERL